MEERRQAILDIVNQLGEINFTQLKQFFPDVSEVTLRKDLKHLDETKQLVRTHGGAKSLPYVLNFTQRAGMHQKEKSLIASKAVKLIRPYDSIFIASGSTCAELAKLIPPMPLSAFTDGLNTALNFPPHSEASIEIMGGRVDLNTMRISGPSVLESIGKLRFNTAFLGTPGFHPKYGFSNLSAFTAAIVEKVISRSEKVVILMDSSKLNYSCSPRNTPLEAVNIVVSHGKLDPEIVKHLENHNITVL